MKDQKTQAVVALQSELEALEARINAIKAEPVDPKLEAKFKAAEKERVKTSLAYEKATQKAQELADQIARDKKGRTNAASNLIEDLRQKRNVVKVQLDAVLKTMGPQLGGASSMPYIPTQGDMERVAQDVVNRMIGRR